MVTPSGKFSFLKQLAAFRQPYAKRLNVFPLCRDNPILAVVVIKAVAAVKAALAAEAVANKAETQDLAAVVMTKVVMIATRATAVVKAALAAEAVRMVAKAVVKAAPGGARRRITGKHSPKPAADYTYQSTSSCMRCFMRYNKQYGRI